MGDEYRLQFRKNNSSCHSEAASAGEESAFLSVAQQIRRAENRAFLVVVCKTENDSDYELIKRASSSLRR
jgi:hypothetical protein